MVHKCHMKYGRLKVPNQDFLFPNPDVGFKKRS
jgi:hypothetical protein